MSQVRSLEEAANIAKNPLKRKGKGRPRGRYKSSLENSKGKPRSIKTKGIKASSAAKKPKAAATESEGKYHCKHCGIKGHNRRTCPQLHE